MVNEIRVGEGDRLQLFGDLEQPILRAQLGQHRVRRGLDDPRPWVVALVDAMAKAHQPERVVLVLGAVDRLGDVAAVSVDRLEHLQHFLVRAAMERAPQR